MLSPRFAPLDDDDDSKTNWVYNSSTERRYVHSTCEAKSFSPFSSWRHRQGIAESVSKLLQGRAGQTGTQKQQQNFAAASSLVWMRRRIEKVGKGWRRRDTSCWASRPRLRLMAAVDSSSFHFAASNKRGYNAQLRV